MAKKSSLGALAAQVEQERLAKPSDSAGRTGVPQRARMGKPPKNAQPGTGETEPRKALTVYLRADIPPVLKIMAAEEGTTILALVGEALDLLMRSRNRHPFGFR